jgi:hypothetical protein
MSRLQLSRLIISGLGNPYLKYTRHGNMTAGTPTEPFRNKINITLHGQKNSYI